MAYSGQSVSPDGFERVNSIRSNASSGRYSRMRSSTFDAMSEVLSVSSESPRARYQDQLHELAVAAGIQVTLPKPLLSGHEQRATPQNPSDKAAAETLLMSMRQKKFLVGKSSKGFTRDEIMLGLDKAVNDNMSLPVIEALLQLAESSGVSSGQSTAAFTTGKKGHAVPTIDYVFGRTEHSRSIDMWRLFLPRVSQRALDSSLAGILKGRPKDVARIQGLLEWSANPALCQDQILSLISRPSEEELEDTIETLLLSQSLCNSDFLNTALTKSIATSSLRNTTMLLFRGADANANQGEALKLAISSCYYHLALAILLLSQRPATSAILDDASGLTRSWMREEQKAYMKILLYAGAAGPRTSGIIVPYIMDHDREIISILVDASAFQHRSFPFAKLFHATVELGDKGLAIDILNASHNASFSEYASTGAHLQLVRNYSSLPVESSDLIAQLFKLRNSDDYASQMLITACEPERIGFPEISGLINQLIQEGNASAAYADGKCLLLAIESARPAVVESLVATRPPKKVLNTAIAHASVVLDDNDPVKLQILATLARAGASGNTVDQQLVLAVDDSPKALSKVKALLPAASLDYSEGEAIVRAIRLHRLDILDACLEHKRPQSSLVSIWKHTRRLFALAAECPYDLPFVRQTFTLLYSCGKHSAPLNDLLHEASQCRYHETALSLCSLMLSWGASPDHDLGAALVACVERSNHATLAVLLSQTPSKTSLKYAFEAALPPTVTDRYQLIKSLIKAGAEKPSLDAALPQVLSEQPYDSSLAQLLVDNGARLHSSVGESLVTPAEHLDMHVVEPLIEKQGGGSHLLLPLKAVLTTHSDWQSADGQSLPMVKLLLAHSPKGTWADTAFISSAKASNQHSAQLFAEHLTSRQTFSDSLNALLSRQDIDLSRQQLSMAEYLLSKGARGNAVDEVFLRAVQVLNYEWIVALNLYLRNPAVRLSAFASATAIECPDAASNNRRLEIIQYLLQQGLKGPAVDEAFINAAIIGDIKALEQFLPFVSSDSMISKTLSTLANDPDFTSTETSRAIVAILAQHGASEASILDAARAASYYDSMTGVQLMMSLSSRKKMACKAAFQGLMDVQDPLSSASNRTILGFLLENGLDREDSTRVAHIAASAYDLPLMKYLQSADESGYFSLVALESIAGSRTDWLSPQGLAFLEHILKKAPRSPVVIRLIQDAARRLNIAALRMVLPKATDKQQALDAAFTALMSDKNTLSSTEGLSIIQCLLGEGASSPAVVSAAEHAARTSNYEALDIFLGSPAVAHVLPAAFKIVARDKSSHLSSEQLSIASILVKHGVSTEVLAIAATEAAKLLDFEALKVLSESPRFKGVCDDTLRALLSEDHLWKSPEGLRIMRFLLDTGVFQQSLNLAVTKTAAALDIDAMRIVFTAKDDPEIAEQAFSSMIGSGSAWLSPEGVRIADFLLKKDPAQVTIDKAFIQASQHLYNDAVQLLHPYIVEVAVFASALGAATSSDSEWLSKLHLVEQLLDSGVEGAVIEAALIKGARALNLDCLELLSSRVDRWEVYANALAAAQTNQNWRSSLHVVEFLLRHGASGEAVDTAYVSAAGDLDLRSVTLLAGHVHNSLADNRAFTAAASTEAWLAPRHFELMNLLYDRSIAPTTVKPALVAAAKALNVPMVELLAAGASESLVSAAFEAASDGNIDWASVEGTSILTTLAQKGARGKAVEQTLISSAAQFRLDLVKSLIGNVEKGNMQCVSRALDQVLATDDQWVFDHEALDILEILIDNGATSEAAHNALVTAAQKGNLVAVNTLTRILQDPATFTNAFAVLTQSTVFWLEDRSLGLLETLLVKGASGEPVHSALIDATQQVILGNASMDLLDFLIGRGADINYANGMVLRLAAKSASVELFQFFLSRGLNAITLYMGLQEALCRNHDEQTVLELFRSVAGDSSLAGTLDVNSDYELGSPLIFYALQNYPNSTPLIQELCELGVDLATTVEWSVYDDEREMPPPEADHIPPLLFAILNGASDEVIIDVLLAYGANIDYLPSKCRANALILAAKHNRASVLSTILDQGAGVAQKDCYDRTALFYAARTGSVPALTSLIKKKPPPNDGSLHEAARELHPEALKILLAASHDINFPSMKHGGRNPLCELCHKCKGGDDAVGLHNTLWELNAAKVAPLRKCRGRTALFFALENEDPIPVVTKLIEVCLWQPEVLNDHANVFEKDNYSYSATMYIKKGLCMRPESVALGVLDVLKDASVQDRYYAKERMQQPSDAVGMPQRIADLDHKKWIRSNRLEEEQEDHERRLRREIEEMTQRDQLVTKRHLLTIEQREDLALQTINHNADTHWQGTRFRSIENDQSLRYKDQHMTQRLDELAATHRLKYNLDRRVQEAQLLHDSRTSQQKLGYLDQEQDLKFDGARAQQILRLDGISAENVLKNEQQTDDLQFKVARGAIDRADMDYKLHHAVDMNSERVQTSQRMEDIARDSQQRKNLLDEENRLAQLNYQELSDDRKLNTERGMNMLRRENNDETLRTISDKNFMAEADRQNQLRFSTASDYQKLNTLMSQGHIQNDTLRQKGQIENRSLKDKNFLLQQNRVNELYHLASMGRQCVENERDMGEQRIENERGMGEQRIENERGMGEQRIENEKGMGQQRIENERGMGQQRIESVRLMGEQMVLNERSLGDARDFTQQRSNQRNRERIGDNLAGQQAGNRMNRERLADGVRVQQIGAALNRQKQLDNVRAQQMGTALNRQKQLDNVRTQQMGTALNRQKQLDNMSAQAYGQAMRGP